MTVPNFTAGQVLTAAELDTLRSALGMAIPDFVAGQVLTAAELNELVDVANNAIFYGTATGGTGVVTVTIGGIDYAYTSFTSTGTLTVTKTGLFDVLVFGGGCGGGGDNSYSGGGGSGGISQQTVYFSANQTVTIGAGGAVDATGSPSSVGVIPTAIAAAGGVYTAVISGRYGTLGGMSGNGVGSNTGPTNVQGYTGGSASTNAGGGGGSTTVAGQNASANVGGNGGAGYNVSAFIGGSALYKGAGGGGGAGTTGGTGGSSIGGNGASGAGNATAAAANTASGGGSRGSSGLAAAGGSGIIYIRWKV